MSTYQRSFMELYRTLPPIPAQMWADRQVRDAFARWGFGAVARLVRRSVVSTPGDRPPRTVRPCRRTLDGDLAWESCGRRPFLPDRWAGRHD